MNQEILRILYEYSVEFMGKKMSKKSHRFILTWYDNTYSFRDQQTIEIWMPTKYFSRLHGDGDGQGRKWILFMKIDKSLKIFLLFKKLKFIEEKLIFKFIQEKFFSLIQKNFFY